MSVKSKDFIIITSIFPPTDAVAEFAKFKNWQLIVVGDKKTPPKWKYEGVIYLGPEDQERMGLAITKVLPWNHYCRKMVGYLYAMREGAETIFDTDDDNVPKSSWPAMPVAKDMETLANLKFVNIYEYFTDKFVWPRGYPLDKILSKEKAKSSKLPVNVGVWQFLADEDTDVDAIYRLTNNEPVYFKDRQPIALAKNTVCPFNSQNTAFVKELFPLLYLPAFVTFRFTDILRGLVAQPLMWAKDYQLGFGPATVVQKRNPHDFRKDFESEVPVYLHAEEVVDITIEALKNNSGKLIDQLASVYSALRVHGIVDDNEIKLVNAWAKDIKNLYAS